MTRIEHAGWRIESLPECWVLSKTKVRTNKKGAEEEFAYQPYYYSSLNNALRGLLEHDLREADAIGLQAILARLEAQQEALQRILEEVPNGCQ